jgi:hypothetical protein
MLYGLTPQGVAHTAIRLVAVVCGFWALAVGSVSSGRRCA